jgi:diketogulonate reductase-like aldo/keto reductase
LPLFAPAEAYHRRMSARPEPPRTVVLPGGEHRPALGLGTWQLGERRARRAAEVAALRLAFEIGYRVIDTAEMYAEGGAEEVVGEAVAGALADGLAREDLFVVSKVYPHHADRAGMLAACERSLRRLRLPAIDLYLLHWRGAVPLAETLAGFAELRRRGWIRHWGVSNFDVADMEELFALDGGAGCAANQVYYSLSQRGVEFDLLPWQRARGMALMAYCPIDQGALGGADAPAALRDLAGRHHATPAQVALAAVLSQPGVMAIPKAVQAAHLRENWAAQALVLDADDRAALDRACAPPRGKTPLAMS